MSTLELTEVIDGRSARKDRNRTAVVEAVLDLMDEGDLDPSVDEITRTSGVSQRSVFRYFEGLDDLRRAVVEYHFERIEPLLHIPSADEGDLESRTKRFVNARIKLYEYAPNATRVAWARAAYSAEVAQDAQNFRDQMDEQIQASFGPELSRLKAAEAADVTALIAAVVSFDAWDQLVFAHQRSAALVRRAWTKGITALLRA
jgi:AcrR family transcriptional regulator